MAFKLVPAEQVLGGQFLGKYVLAGTYMQSPDYVPGVSGWAIFGDGSAEFNNGTFRGVVEIADANGQGWELNDNMLIALGSFTYAPGGDGFLYAVPAAAVSAQSDMFITSPTDNDLIAVLTLSGESNDTTLPPAVALTAFNNATQVTSGLPLRLWDLAAAPSAGNGATLYSAAGHGKYVSSADANAYDTGVLHLIATGQPQTINSTSPSVITGLSAPVAAATYRIHGKIRWKQGATQAQQAIRFMSTGVASAVEIEVNAYELSTGGESVFASSITALNTDSGNQGASGQAGGVFAVWDFDGYITFSAAATFSVEARCVTSNADTYAIQAGFCDLEPVA
jgi:hypothetical protein